MIEKRVICPDRIRFVPKQFSWVDHALVRKKYICGLRHESLALYLFLLTVSDAEGLSYYSDSSINRYVNLDSGTLTLARRELCKTGLVAYSSPFYQVLSLQNTSGVLPPAPCEKYLPDINLCRTTSDAIRIGDILANCMGGVQ